MLKAEPEARGKVFKMIAFFGPIWSAILPAANAPKNAPMRTDDTTSASDARGKVCLIDASEGLITASWKPNWREPNKENVVDIHNSRG